MKLNIIILNLAGTPHEFQFSDNFKLFQIKVDGFFTNFASISLPCGTTIVKENLAKVIIQKINRNN
jgi:hypothetical protein